MREGEWRGGGSGDPMTIRETNGAKFYSNLKLYYMD